MRNVTTRTSAARQRKRSPWRQWLTLALRLVVSLLTVTLSAAPCHAELAWTAAPVVSAVHAVRAVDAAATQDDNEEDPAVERNVRGDADRAIVPSGVHIESASATRGRGSLPQALAVLPSMAKVRAFYRIAGVAPPRMVLRPLSPSRARAFLMVFLN